LGAYLLTVSHETYVKRADNNGVIEERIENYLNDTTISSKLIVISGEYGIGKTCLVEIILDILKKQKRYVIHFDRKRKPIQKDYLCEAVANMLEETGYAIKHDRQVQANNFKYALPDFDVTVPSFPLFRLKFSSKAICQLVQDLWKGTYAGTLKNVEYTNNLYVSKLSQIIFTVYDDIAKGLKNKDKKAFVQPCFYIVFDDFEDIRARADELIRKIMYQVIPNVCIVVTTSNSVENMQNSVAQKLIYDICAQFQKENVDVKSKRTFPLPPFAEPEVKEYLKCRQCDTSVKTIQTALENSHGLPWLLSILCEEPGFLVSSNPNINAFLKDYCNQVIFRQFSDKGNNVDHYRRAIFALAANDGSIDTRVFAHFIKNDDIILALIHAHVVQKRDGIYEFRIKQLSDALYEIANSTPKDTELWNMSQQSLLASYKNFSPDAIVSPYHWYISIIRLMLDLNEKVQDIYAQSSKGCDELIVNRQPDYGVDIVDLVLRDNRLTQRQRISLQYCKLRALYYSKKLDETIELYKQIRDNPENHVLSNDQWELIQYYVAKSYYYKNDPDNTIELCNKITDIADDTKPHTVELYYKAGLLKIVALDLAGRYHLCFQEFDKLKDKAEQIDKLCVAHFSMAIQMRSSTHLECVAELKRAIETFSPHIDDTAREWACSQNNLGIEYLMQGEKPNEAKEHLQKSIEYFSGRLEEHFPHNNLGLYYQYFVANGSKQARSHFKKAIQSAVSPLQQAYTRINLAILECQESNWEQGQELFKQAAEFVDKCPDPLAKSYFAYNYAMYLFKRGQTPQASEYLKESCEKLSKPQVSNLFDKRQRLASQINCTIPPKIWDAIVDRRKFFAEQEWEPCELMFYE